MPIPGSILGNLLPIGADAAAPMYGSRATLRPMAKSTDTTGQETHVFADSTDPTQTNLPCRKSPLIQIRPQNQEAEQGGDFERIEAKFQVNFLSYINVPDATLVTWQVKIDGNIYQIKSVESDGNNITSRLMISDIVPYNA